MRRQCQSDTIGEVPSCRSCPLGDASLFSVLPEVALSEIQKHVETFAIERGESLYSTGGQGEYLYTVRKGMLKLVQYLPDGTQRIVRLLRAADLAGIEAMVEDLYQHDAVALENTEVCRYPVHSVRELSRTNERIHHDLMARWQRALKEADAFVTQLSTGTAKQRVARLLIRLTEAEENDSCSSFSREDIGAILGITTETASRVIAEFKRQGLLVEVEGKPSRFLCDVPNLTRIATV